MYVRDARISSLLCCFLVPPTGPVGRDERVSEHLMPKQSDLLRAVRAARVLGGHTLRGRQDWRRRDSVVHDNMAGIEPCATKSRVHGQSHMHPVKSSGSLQHPCRQSARTYLSRRAILGLFPSKAGSRH
jgi:hypothetical protein